MIICVKCRLEMTVKCVGVNVISLVNGCGHKVYSGDCLECLQCGTQMIVPSPHPFLEHYQDGFAERVAALKPDQEGSNTITFWHTRKERLECPTPPWSRSADSRLNNPHKCVVCHLNYVDAEEGYDTCISCEVRASKPTAL